MSVLSAFGLFQGVTLRSVLYKDEPFTEAYAIPAP